MFFKEKGAGMPAKDFEKFASSMKDVKYAKNSGNTLFQHILSQKSPVDDHNEETESDS